MSESTAKKIALKRHKYRCDMCIVTISKKRLEVHHLNDKTTYPKLAAEPKNLMPLCKKHHRGFHSWNGGTQNSCTKKDYLKYKTLKQDQFQAKFGVVLFLSIIIFLVVKYLSLSGL